MHTSRHIAIEKSVATGKTRSQFKDHVLHKYGIRNWRSAAQYKRIAIEFG